MIEQQPTFMPAFTDWSIAERQFDLRLESLPEKMLFLPAGFTSVGAELKQHGVKVTCADIHYALGSFDLERKMGDALRDAASQCERDDQCAPDMTSTWQAICNAFWQDFQSGKVAQRYVPIKNILHLPWRAGEFQLACCSGLMIEDQTAVLNLINELLRVSHEVRIYPWLIQGEEVKKTLASVLIVLQQMGVGVELRANTMLRIWSKTCVVI